MNEDCGSGEKFVESHCTPDNKRAPLQAYEYTCSKVVPTYRAFTHEYVGNRTALMSRDGQCTSEELCVDGFGELQIASCVHMDVFSDAFENKNGQVIGMVAEEVFDAKKMYAVMAKMDGTVAIKARKMGIVVSNSGANGNGGAQQSKSCANCENIETDLLQPGLDSLKIEATLMAAAGVSGVLWLAMG